MKGDLTLVEKENEPGTPGSFSGMNMKATLQAITKGTANTFNGYLYWQSQNNLNARGIALNSG